MFTVNPRIIWSYSFQFCLTLLHAALSLARSHYHIRHLETSIQHSSLTTWQCTIISTFLIFELSAFTGCANSDVSGDQSMPKQRRHWFMPSWCPVWTTATLYSLELQSLSWTSYNECSIRQRVLLAVLGSMIVAWRHSSTPSYTGLMFQIEWHTSSACWCTGVCKARLWNTSSTA